MRKLVVLAYFVLCSAMVTPLLVPSVVAPVPSDEWLAYKMCTSFDSDGDGYDDSVQIKIDADTNSEEEVNVYAYAFLNATGPFFQEFGVAWEIYKDREEIVYLYLCAPTNVSARNYDVSISLFDGDGFFEDTWLWPDVFLYPPAPPNLVVRGWDNRIYYRAYAGGSWESWHVVPEGFTCDSPAAAVYDGRLYMVVRGMDGYSLYFGWVNLADHSFSDWTMLSGATESAPTLFCYEATLGLVVRGLDNGIYYRFYDCISEVWEDWTRISTGATGDSPAAAMMDGDLHIVVRGLSGGLYHWSWLWFEWNWMSGDTPSAPTLTSNLKCTRPPHSDEFQHLYIAVRGFSNRIYWATWDEWGWNPWNEAPGYTCDAPGVARQPSEQGYSDMWPDDGYDCDTRLHFVVRGSDGARLWHGYVNQDEEFSDWMLLDGSTPSAPRLTP